MNVPLLTVSLKLEADIVNARQRARQLAALLGFDSQDQTRIGTAVSELARNAYTYGNGGKAEFSLEGEMPPQSFVVRISDQGPGIPNLQEILNGQYRSRTGMGMGIVGSRRLVDSFEISAPPGRGTTIVFKKTLPRKSQFVDKPAVGRITTELARLQPQTPLEEVQHQNREMLRVLEDLRTRQEALALLNQELADTNRGMVALYAELDEKAEHLRRADDLKTRFLSNMSHEFRTPLNSMLALSRMLMDGIDGDLNEEQQKQVRFIRQGAESLLMLVNDLLDLARIEAGKTVVRPESFSVADLFSALRGMLKPLLVNPDVELIFETVNVPKMYTDEGKVSQILRNFISNALKFTQRGEIRISATLTAGGRNVQISVKDTGIGIAPEDHARIFEEYGQVESAIQRHVRGTGLGLPLSKKLAQLLGGQIQVTSRLGAGSTFSVELPLRFQSADAPPPPLDTGPPILAVDDDETSLEFYRMAMEARSFSLKTAKSLSDARALIQSDRPAAVILGSSAGGQSCVDLLQELKGDPETAAIPVLVVADDECVLRGRTLDVHACAVKPVTQRWLLDELYNVTGTTPVQKLLIVDDDEAWRYVLKGYLSAFPFDVGTANDGTDGMERARRERPQIIIMDLFMPGRDGARTLELLKKDPLTQDIPVIIMTTMVLEPAQKARLLRDAVAVLSKEFRSREEAIDTLGKELVNAGVMNSPSNTDLPSRQETE